MTDLVVFRVKSPCINIYPAIVIFSSFSCFLNHGNCENCHCVSEKSRNKSVPFCNSHQICVRSRSPVLAFNGIIACRRCRTLYYRGWEKLRKDLKRNFADRDCAHLQALDYSTFIFNYFRNLLCCKHDDGNNSRFVPIQVSCKQNCTNCSLRLLLLESGKTMCPQGIWSTELKQQHPVLFQEYSHIINTVRKNCGLNKHSMSKDQLKAFAEKTGPLGERGEFRGNNRGNNRGHNQGNNQKWMKPGDNMHCNVKYEIEGLNQNRESRLDYNKRTFGLVFGRDEASTSKQTKINELRMVHTVPRIKQESLENELLENRNNHAIFEIQRKVLDGIDKTCQKIHDNDCFESFLRNKVNPDSKAMHVFYGENQNSNPSNSDCSDLKKEGVLEVYRNSRDNNLESEEHQPETEPGVNQEVYWKNPSPIKIQFKNAQPDTQQMMKLTDAFKTNIISKLWPAVGAANITNDQAKKFFDDHSKFFESTLCELFLNAYRHGNFKNLDTNEPPDTVCKNLAKYSAFKNLRPTIILITPNN